MNLGLGPCSSSCAPPGPAAGSGDSGDVAAAGGETIGGFRPDLNLPPSRAILSMRSTDGQHRRRGRCWTRVDAGRCRRSLSCTDVVPQPSTGDSDRPEPIAHNPEVAGSNPAPATNVSAGQRHDHRSWRSCLLRCGQQAVCHPSPEMLDRLDGRGRWRTRVDVTSGSKSQGSPDLHLGKGCARDGAAVDHRSKSCQGPDAAYDCMFGGSWVRTR